MELIISALIALINYNKLTFISLPCPIQGTFWVLVYPIKTTPLEQCLQAMALPQLGERGTGCLHSSIPGSCKYLCKSSKYRSLGQTETRLQKDASHLITWLRSYFLKSWPGEPKAPWHTRSKQGLGNINGRFLQPKHNILLEYHWKDCASPVTGWKEKKYPQPFSRTWVKKLKTGTGPLCVNSLQTKGFLYLIWQHAYNDTTNLFHFN